MNVFYIPNVGYVYNKKIWLRFEKLIESLYNELEGCESLQLLVTVCSESDEMDRVNKECWVNFLLYKNGKHEDA